MLFRSKEGTVDHRIFNLIDNLKLIFIFSEVILLTDFTTKT